MNYFDYSQTIKQEILERKDLLKKINSDFLWYDFKGERPEFIDSGETNKMHRVGQLKNGLWIALRTSIKDMPSLDVLIEKYECFCQFAELFYKGGKRVPKFSIGVKNWDSQIGILVEDLTEGGKREIVSSYASMHGHFKDNVNEKVYFDLDNYYIGEPLELKYFKPENMIEFDKEKFKELY